MRCHNAITAVAVLGLFVISAARCCADEPAMIPYRDLCRLARVRFDGAATAGPRQMSFAARSTNPNVKSSDLRYTLRSGDESHDVAIAEDGAFVLPVNQKWFENSATVVTNQPKGTLVTRFVFEHVESGVEVTAHLQQGRINFAALLELAAEGCSTAVAEEAAQRADGKEVKLDVAKPDGELVLVVWVSDGDASATVAIVDKVVDLPGKPAVQKRGPGIFVIPLTETLLKENPELALSENPSWKCCFRQTARSTSSVQLNSESSDAAAARQRPAE